MAPPWSLRRIQTRFLSLRFPPRMSVAEWIELFILILAFALSLAVIAIGWLFGPINEKRHFHHLNHREAATRSRIMVTSLRSLPAGWQVDSCTLVTGSMVVANDAFKSPMISIRKLSGGNIRPAESMMEQGRREAVLPLTETASSFGAKVLWNV